MLVSVVIPNLNSAPFLEQALDSVLTQDYSPVEVIVVDNMSTDGSAEILERYKSCIAVSHCSSIGAAAARNAGLRASRGELIAFNDADDVWLPDRLAAQVAYLRHHPDIGIVFGQLAYWRPDSAGNYESPHQILAEPDRWEIKEPLSGWIYADELLSSHIGMITPLVRRQVFDVVGQFDESLEAGSDYDFWLRATYHFQAHKLPMCLALYRLHGNSVTSRPRSWSPVATVLERAIHRTGLTGPDGRAVTSEQIDRRFAQIWRDFTLTHLVSGEVRSALRGMSLYSRYEGSLPRAIWKMKSAVPWAIRQRIARG